MFNVDSQKFWNAIIGESRVQHAIIAYITSTQLFGAGHMYVIATARCLSEYCNADSRTTKAMWGHWDYIDPALTQITGSPLLVGRETTFHKFTTTYCCYALRFYSSFHLASTIVIISLTWQINSNYVFWNFIGSTKIPVKFTQNGPKSLDLPPPCVCILKAIRGAAKALSSLD